MTNPNVTRAALRHPGEWFESSGNAILYLDSFVPLEVDWVGASTARIRYRDSPARSLRPVIRSKGSCITLQVEEQDPSTGRFKEIHQ